MKKSLLFSVCILFILFSCENINSDKNEKNTRSGGSFELFGKDTANITDMNGQKQGIWYSYKITSSGREFTDTLFYKNDTLVEP